MPWQWLSLITITAILTNLIFDNILGYIPRKCNAQLATMMDMGWTDLLNVEIMEIKRNAAYSDRIHIAVYIRSKEQ